MKIRYCICLSDNPIVSKIYNEVKVEAVYIAHEYQKRAIKNLPKPGNSIISYNVCCSRIAERIKIFVDIFIYLFCFLYGFSLR